MPPSESSCALAPEGVAGGVGEAAAPTGGTVDGLVVARAEVVGAAGRPALAAVGGDGGGSGRRGGRGGGRGGRGRRDELLGDRLGGGALRRDRPRGGVGDGGAVG